MQNAAVQIPDQLASIIGPLLLILVALSLVWLVLSVMGYMHRRAYNLTRAESGGSGGVKPDFLRVDHARREAAIASGAAYDAARAAADASPAAERGSRLAGLAVAATAIVTFLATAGGALTKIEAIQGAYNSLTSWERFVALISAYKVGFSLALIFILCNLVLLVMNLSRKHKA